MKVLFVCNKSPFPAHEGGPIAMKSIIDGLLKTGNQVKVLAVNSGKYNVDLKDIAAEVRENTGLTLVDVDLRIKPIGALKALLRNRSYHVERFISTSFKKELVRILDTETYDVVQLETVFMAPYIPIIRKHSKAVIVLRAHNIEHLIWKRLARQSMFLPKRFYLNHLSETLRQFELQSLNQVDGIAAITRKDASFFRGFTHKSVVDIPYSINTAKFVPVFEVAASPVFFHLGSMNWIPNQEGIKWMLDKVWPKVISKVPDARFVLAGRFMPDWLLSYKAPGVEVIGEVEDATDFVQKNHIAVVPLLSGSGIRIKIIEAMALGKTVVTTNVGAEGINFTDRYDIFIADDAAKMAALMVLLFQHPEKAYNCGVTARKLVEEQHNSDKVNARLLKFYNNLIQNTCNGLNPVNH
ncbi:MAG: glycosyltransferase family 4 protein [Bacteroidales bacterium]|nr:glycosyltransferase family 4 protein [Bacteroidales bacterium]HOI32909.1 glycosyltransferase family 4 protein [Bacteroidales bacterium]